MMHQQETTTTTSAIPTSHRATSTTDVDAALPPIKFEDESLDDEEMMINDTFRNLEVADSSSLLYGRSYSPTCSIDLHSDALSLLNLSISPIASPEPNFNRFKIDNYQQSIQNQSFDNEAMIYESGGGGVCGGYGNGDDDHISLEEITKLLISPIDQIRPVMASEQQEITPGSGRSKKKLNLDTIYEGVFLETPPRRTTSSSKPLQTACSRNFLKNNVIKSNLHNDTTDSNDIKNINNKENDEEFSEKGIFKRKYVSI